MKKILSSVCCLLVAGILNAQLTQGSITSASSPGGRTYFYQYKPPHYNDNNNLLPLIVSMHGVAQAGDPGGAQLTNVLSDGLPALVSNGLQLEFTYQNTTQGFVLLAPQTDRDLVNNWPTFYVDEMIAYGIANLRVDPARVFLVGFSAGGGGVWKYATSSATAAAKLAGIAPAASSKMGTDFCNIASQKVAVWAYHGGADGVISEQTDQSRTALVNACNPIIPAIDTIYFNEAHGIYTSVVYNATNSSHYPNVFQWMMKVNRNLNPATNQSPVPVIAGPSVINLTTPVMVKDFPVLDGSGSTDNDDIIMDYLWEQTSGPTVLPDVQNSGYRQWPTVKIAPTNGSQFKIDPGTYNFRLRVKDYLTSKPGHTQFANVTVNVALPGNGYSAPATDVGNDVVLAANVSQYKVIGQASGYVCTDCNVVGYDWVKVSGPSATLSDYNNSGQAYGPGENAIWFTNLTTPGVYKFQFSARSAHGDVGTSVLTITKLGALPVTYSYFTGQNTGGNNVLNWATTAELNSERFDIQRSADGTSFATIGSLSSKGGSGLTTYTYSDNNAAPGVTYYRLSQVDKDSRSSLSSVVSINNRKAGIYIERYPNPVHDNLTVTLQSITTGNAQVAIADMQGKIIMQQQWLKDQSLFKKIINVGALKNGVYQMIITMGSDKQISSFVKY